MTAFGHERRAVKRIGVKSEMASSKPYLVATNSIAHVARRNARVIAEGEYV